MTHEDLTKQGDRAHEDAEQAVNAELGAVLGGMIAYDQAMSNSLLDRIIDDYIALVRRYDATFNAVHQVNDSLKVERALYNTVPAFILDGDAYHKIEHLEGLKMGGRP